MTTLGDHLWQSTLFVLAAAVLSWILRRNAARVRGWIWTAASLKFLLPFAIFIALGGRLAWAPAFEPQPQISLVLDTISQPLSRTSAFAPASPRPSEPRRANGLATIAVDVWAAGSLLLALRWAGAWARVWRTSYRGETLTAGREVDAIATVVSGFSRTMNLPIRLCDNGFEPGVFGVFRPVLLWPRGFGARLSDAQLHAVIAHEICHVRRRDNLVAALHMVVETLFWYHPLVWWVGARLVDERERACDEAVVALGGAPEAYAEGILRTCEYYVESPLMSVSGITGSDLKRRIEEIMRPTARVRLTAARKLLIACAVLAAIVVPLASGALAGTSLLQAPTPAVAGGTPAFDVISIKRNLEPGNNFPLTPPVGGRLSLRHQTVRGLISSSYGVQDYLIIGGPDWLRTDGFDIDAVAEGTPPPRPPQMLLMIRTLLADRFKLVMRNERRDVPIYKLVMARSGGQLGPNIHPGQCVQRPQTAAPPLPQGGPPPCGTRVGIGSMSVVGGTMTLLAQQLGRYAGVGRPVVNETNVTGTFDWELKWTPDSPAGNPVPSDAVSIFTALPEQLGVKLEAARGLVDVLVIDGVEQPSDNFAAPAQPATLRMDETDHFDVFFQPGAASQLAAIEREGERAYTAVATETRHDVPFRPALVIFATGDALQRGSSAEAIANAIPSLKPDDARVLIAADAPAPVLMDSLVRQVRELFARDTAPARPKRPSEN